ncbi:hypothetical protein [Gallibacterium anatis]|uniref:hypothetical protein n=1 Tax=Gallibacterium anatis TaxID=750 RepID=UPI00398A0AFF
MKARYVFEFNLSAAEKAVLISTDLLPRPTGVLMIIMNLILRKHSALLNQG